MMKRVLGFAIALFGVAVVAASPSYASLSVFQSLTGNLNVSTDGCGSTSQDCTLTANAEFGSTVVAAYLYTSTFFNGSAVVPTGDTLNGNAVTYTANLGQDPSNCCQLNAFRADVTSIVAAVIDGGAGGAYNFAMHESAGSQDGEALVVVYSNGAFAVTTIGILDGFSASAGDTTTISFLNPLDPTAAGFEAEMRLGIGFSCCGQDSTVTVNGTDITTVAGNNDDGDAVANGSLITMGGDNDPFSTLLPAYADDHERYNLVPYITTGDTSINVSTLNPSNDDNIFLAVFKVTGEGRVDTCNPNCPPPPTSSAPEPGTLALLGIGLASMGLYRRLARKG